VARIIQDFQAVMASDRKCYGSATEATIVHVQAGPVARTTTSPEFSPTRSWMGTPYVRKTPSP